MDKKTIVLVIVVCAVVFSVGIFAGRFIMPIETPVSTPISISTPTPTPIPRATPSPTITPINEIEYPVTAYFTFDYDSVQSSVQITLNEGGSASYKETGKERKYGNWKITGSTSTRIEYRIGAPRWYCEIWLFSNHGAIFDPGEDDIPGYWR